MIISARGMKLNERSLYKIQYELTKLHTSETRDHSSSDIFCPYCFQEFHWEENLKEHVDNYCKNDTNPKTQERNSAQKILGFKIAKEYEDNKKTPNSQIMAAFFQTRDVVRRDKMPNFKF